MNTKIKTTTYRSDGSDGYSEGTWGWIVEAVLPDGRNTWFDGGYASRSLARRDAVRTARRLERAAVRTARLELESAPRPGDWDYADVVRDEEMRGLDRRR